MSQTNERDDRTAIAAQLNTMAPRVPIVVITRMQRVVLQELTKDGATNQQIANRMGVSLDTVKSHIAGVLRRMPAGLGIDSRCALAVALLRGTVKTRVLTQAEKMDRLTRLAEARRNAATLTAE